MSDKIKVTMIFSKQDGNDEEVGYRFDSEAEKKSFLKGIEAVEEYYGWSIANVKDERQFVCCWNSKEYQPNSAQVDFNFFTQSQGFDQYDAKLVNELNVGEVSAHGIVGGLKVVRIA